jgi:tetratricopeptide (TPR) repeat protein
MDIQGADVAKPYVDKAGVTYTALVDENNILGELFDVNYVPLHYIIDEFGIYRMNERDPQKIEEFLDREKVDTDIIAQIDYSQSIYNIQGLQELVKKHPNNSSAHLLLGDALIQQKRYSEGINKYKKAIELEPKSAKGFFRIGKATLKQNKKEEALKELKKALELDPGNWIIIKQIWALEHTEKFYEGAVDYDWQKTQIK